MRHRLVFHDEAARELNDLYDYIAQRANPDIAWHYVQAIRLFLEELSDFPERGTVRTAPIAGLRIIGFRRRLGIAFIVRDENLIVLGIFHAGRNMRRRVLAERARSME
ncbi:type II toxin-antitoxin system RelE/ParE family toxin [Rhizobium sp. SAFR-030]|uniref:type II toxin-antitoxin system RelE/ParE family toxin n=1 Tax=Rhizobium sp. SAFR-030 TaxID=3387277 RepID=UPI003F8033F4